MMKKAKPKPKFNSDEVIEQSIEEFKIQLKELKKQYPKEYREAMHMADEIILNLEDEATEFEVGGIAENCYWLMLAIHSAYAATGFSNRLIAQLKYVGITLMNSNGKPFNNHYE